MSKPREPLPEWLAEIEAMLAAGGRRDVPVTLAGPTVDRLLALCVAQRKAMAALVDWDGSISDCGSAREKTQMAQRQWEGK